VALVELLRACGATRWAERLVGSRPFASHLDLLATAENAFDLLAEADWLEAFGAHPKIGDRASLAAKFASTAAWAEGEQAGTASASEKELDELAQGNEEYEKRFGFLFIVCATGQPAFRMLASLRDRMTNPRDIELGIAADEQRRITRLRLEKLLAEGA
jgi:2-oxo-4-hydroxy-4-carboxy-5-ureidoimidazoline decarboxylase